MAISKPFYNKAAFYHLASHCSVLLCEHASPITVLEEDFSMGLFDFAANLGKKLFGSNDDPAEKIQQHIAEDNPGIDQLTVTVTDGIAHVAGTAKDQAAFEKAILMAGNVQGISEVKADQLQLTEPAAAQVEYYTIASGDTLWAIAQRFLGNGNDYNKIFAANKEVIKDPNLIYPGQKIRIPLS